MAKLLVTEGIELLSPRRDGPERDGMEHVGLWCGLVFRGETSM